MTDARTLTKRLGGRWHGGDNGYGLCCCPCHDDRSPSLSVSDGDKEKLILKCFAGCDWKSIKDTLRASGDLDLFVPGELPAPRPKPARGNNEADEIKLAVRLWDKATPLWNTLGERYFTKHRRLNIGALDDLSHALRWSDGIKAVLALMTDAATGEPCGVQRTYLKPRDGTKRTRQMKGKRGVTRLSPGDRVTDHLAIAEGVEKCIALMLDGISPVWCAQCADGVGAFPVLGGIEALTIFADDDDAGIKGAEACVARWRQAGRRCIALYPKDFQ